MPAGKWSSTTQCSRRSQEVIRGHTKQRAQSRSNEACAESQACNQWHLQRRLARPPLLPAQRNNGNTTAQGHGIFLICKLNTTQQPYACRRCSTACAASLLHHPAARRHSCPAKQRTADGGIVGFECRRGVSSREKGLNGPGAACGGAFKQRFRQSTPCGFCPAEKTFQAIFQQSKTSEWSARRRRGPNSMARDPCWA